MDPKLSEQIINICASILVFLFAKLFADILYRIFLRVELETSLSVKYKNSTRTIINLIMFSLAGFIIISIFFKDLKPAIAGLGVGGVVIGFAVQEPLANLICGLLIMVNKLIYDNEEVEINGVAGTVKEIGLNHVIVRTYDGKRVHIPSKSVWSSQIIHNWPKDFRRNELTVGISYTSDLDKVSMILKRILDTTTFIIHEEEHAPSFVFKGFSGSSIDFRIIYWAKKDVYFDTPFMLLKIIRDDFKKEGIEIPLPQLEVNMKK